MLSSHGLRRPGLCSHMAWVTSAPCSGHHTGSASSRCDSFSSSKKEPLVPVSMTGIIGFKAQKIILRYNQLPKMQVDVQLGASYKTGDLKQNLPSPPPPHPVLCCPHSFFQYENPIVLSHQAPAFLSTRQPGHLLRAPWQGPTTAFLQI